MNKCLHDVILFLGKYMSDKSYINLRYIYRMHKRLNLKNPRTFNEKLQWMKLYDRNPLYTKLVDKYLSKEYVQEKVGPDVIIPFLGVYNCFDEIDFSKLPNQFVIKCSHNCGVIVCKNKNELDLGAAKKKIDSIMKSDYYLNSREWPYKNVPRKVLVEKYMADESGTELKDYKFFCFDGEPKLLFVASDRFKNVCFDFFDLDFKHLDLVNGYPNSSKEIKKPENFDKMIEIASKLSKGLKQVRVDLYNVNGNVYFGEMTFFHFGGMTPFVPESWDYKLGDYIKLNTANE